VLTRSEGVLTCPEGVLTRSEGVLTRSECPAEPRKCPSWGRQSRGSPEKSYEIGEGRGILNMSPAFQSNRRVSRHIACLRIRRTGGKDDFERRSRSERPGNGRDLFAAGESLPARDGDDSRVRAAAPHALGHRLIETSDLFPLALPSRAPEASVRATRAGMRNG
jgi:hypothetical protein